MNKSEFINELSSKLSYSIDKCIVINEILENNFFISKKNKDKIIEEFMGILSVDNEEAIRIYNVALNIIKDDVKNTLKHLFKNN